MEHKEFLSQFMQREIPPELMLNNFRLTDVVGSLEIQDLKPFKKLKFESTEEQKSSLGSEKNFEVSDILSDISFSFEEPKEKETILTVENQKKRTDSKISPKSKKSEKFSTIYTLSSDSSKLVEDLIDAERIGSTKITMQNEDKENLPSKSKEYLEFLPAKKYCKKCKENVLTCVKMELPTLPL